MGPRDDSTNGWKKKEKGLAKIGKKIGDASMDFSSKIGGWHDSFS